MTKKQKKMLVRIIITAVMLVGLKFIPLTGIPQLAANQKYRKTNFYYLEERI